MNARKFKFVLLHVPPSYTYIQSPTHMRFIRGVRAQGHPQCTTPTAVLRFSALLKGTIDAIAAALLSPARRHTPLSVPGVKPGNFLVAGRPLCRPSCLIQEVKYGCKCYLHLLTKSLISSVDFGADVTTFRSHPLQTLCRSSNICLNRRRGTSFLTLAADSCPLG